MYSSSSGIIRTFQCKREFRRKAVVGVSEARAASSASVAPTSAPAGTGPAPTKETAKRTNMFYYMFLLSVLFHFKLSNVLILCGNQLFLYFFHCQCCNNYLFPEYIIKYKDVILQALLEQNLKNKSTTLESSDITFTINDTHHNSVIMCV